MNTTRTTLRTLSRAVIASSLVAGSMTILPLSASAHPAGTPQTCTAPLGAVTVDVQLTVPADSRCELDGTVLHGPVVVEAGGILEGRNVQIAHTLVADNAAGISLLDSSVGETLTVTADGSRWEVGYLYLTDTTVGGAVSVTGDTDVELVRATLKSVTAQNANYTDITDSSIDGALAVSGNDFGTYLCNTDVTGDVALLGNGYEVAAFSDTPTARCYNNSTVGGDLEVDGNDADVRIGQVTVSGDIYVTDNTPRATFTTGTFVCGGVDGQFSGPTPAGTECDGGAAALNWNNYQKTLLTKTVGEPIDLAVLPDGRVLHTSRNGAIRLTDPASGTSNVVNNIPVYANSEDGMQTIGLDPNFAQNNWVYLFYSPQGTTPGGSAPTSLPGGQSDATYWNQWMGVNRLSRFQWTGQSLNLASEQVVIDIPVNRGQCCHLGGDFGWDDEGNLYLATGDNTPAGAPGANGFAPNNDAPGINPGMDARRSSGNTNDLRGKILRIKPNATTPGYTVPAGNMFAPGTAQTKPEIFVMGVRNPFRINVDARTNSLSWGDYGPDSGSADAQRGPMGYVEWNTVSLDEPTNSGWPYCTGNQFAYNEWNFATSTPRGFFDCANPKNNSRWNTGLVDLPPAKPATVWYGDAAGHQPPEWAALVSGGGQGPHGGPVYHYDPTLDSDSAFPAFWDRKAFMAEFAQDYIAAFDVTWPSGPVNQITRFLPNNHLTSVNQPITDNPMTLEFGPDGALYVLEYGDGFFRENPDAGLYKISYTEGNKAPVAAFTANPISSSSAPLTVTFNAAASYDPEGSAITYEWDFDGNGSYDATGPTASHTYTTVGHYTARLKVTDPQGRSGLISRKISVGNQAPVITIDYPAEGGFFDWGQALPYKVSASDPEEGPSTVCTRMKWTFGLGHNEHAHPEESGTGCEGVWPTPVDAPEHGETEKLYGTVVVTYTDNGHNGLPPAEGEATRYLNPKVLQAEHALQVVGAQIVPDDNAAAKAKVVGLETGGHLRFDPVNLVNIDAVKVKAKGIGSLQLRWNSATATPFGSIEISDREAWQTVDHTFTAAPEGTGQLFVTSENGLEVDQFEFVGDGVADIVAPTITHTLDPAVGDEPDGSYSRQVSLTLVATDDHGLRTVEYSTNGGSSWTVVNPAGGLYPPIVFDRPGAQLVQYRATDIGGNVTTGQVSFAIKARACGFEDTFDGTALDTTCRWTQNVRPNPANLSVSDGHLRIVAEPGEINNAATTMRNIVLQEAPTGDWTIETKFTATMQHQYQQAGLVAYADDNNFVKTIMMAGNPSANALSLTAQIGAETGGVWESGGIRQPTVPNPVSPTGYWHVRMVKTGTAYQGFYSSNGETWVSMGDPVTQAANLNKVGLLVTGQGQVSPVTFAFDHFRLCSGADRNPNDEFDGTTLNGCKWTVTNPNPALAKVEDGKWKVTTTNADFYQTGNDAVPNILTTAQPAGNWVLETKVKIDAQLMYQQAGIIVRTDNDNYVRLSAQARTNTGRVYIDLGSEVAAVNAGNLRSAELPHTADDTYLLRLARTGNVYTGSYSLNGGTTWTTLAGSWTNAAVSGGQVGLYALGKNAATQTVAEFDYLRQPATAAPTVTATVNPTAPDTGWHTGPVTVAVQAIGQVARPVTVEYKLGDGAWTAYTAPVAVTTDGTHVVSYRASQDGLVSPVGSVTVKIDSATPTTTAQVSDADPAIVTLTAVDGAGSGVAVTRYRIGTGTWTDYTAPVSVPRTAAVQTVEFRSVDAAGNEEQVRSTSIPAAVPTTPPADITAATACLGGKAVLTLRARNTGSTPLTLTLTTPFGSKTFTDVAPKGMVAFNFTAPGKFFPAGEATITSVTTIDGVPRHGTVSVPFSARTCA